MDASDAYSPVEQWASSPRAETIGIMTSDSVRPGPPDEKAADIVRAARVCSRVTAAMAGLAFYVMLMSTAFVWTALFYVLLFVAAVFAGFASSKGASRRPWLLILSSVCIGLLAANFSARSEQDRFWNEMVHDPRMGWRPAPDLRDKPFKSVAGAYPVTTDENGYRNASMPGRSHYPFLLQGDSNAFGYGVAGDKHLCARISVALVEACYNAAVPGFDLNNYLLQMRALPVTFDTRILLFNLENDFTLSALATPYLIRRHYYEVPEGSDIRLIEQRMPLVKQVYGYRFIGKFAGFDAQLAPFEQGNAWGNSLPNWIESVPALQQVLARNQVFIEKAGKLASRLTRRSPDWPNFPNEPDWLLLKREKWPEPYRSYAQDFEVIFAAYLKLAEGRTVILLRPTRKFVMSKERNEALARLRAKGHGEDDLESGSLNGLIRTIAVRNGATVVDATEAFLAHPDPSSLFITGDTHLNAAGHELIAGLLERHLRERKKGGG